MTNNKLWVLGHQVQPVETIGDYGFLAIKSDPKVPGPPPHYHTDAAELFYIIDGQMDVMTDGNWQTVYAGQSFTVPQGQIHTFINNGDKPVTWITAFSPRGFERFFLDFGVPVDQPGSFEKSFAPEVIEKVTLEAMNYGMIITL